MPLARLVRTWLVARLIGVVPLLVALEIVGLASLAAVFETSRPLFVGEALGRIAIGCAFGISAAIHRPIVATMARASTGRDVAKRRAFDLRVAEPSVRRRYESTTYVWSASYVALGFALLGAAFVVAPAVLVVAEPVLSYATLGGVLWYTIAAGHRTAA